MPGPLSVAELVRHLGLKAEHVAVELNKGLVTRSRHAQTPVSRRRRARGRDLGWRRGGAAPAIEPLKIGAHTFRSRLFVGTGKYASLELMRDCLDASGAEVVTVAVRRERLFDKEGRNLLDYLDPRQVHDPAEHGRVFFGRGCVADGPAGARAAGRAGKPGGELGEARSAG